MWLLKTNKINKFSALLNKDLYYLGLPITAIFIIFNLFIYLFIFWVKSNINFCKENPFCWKNKINN